MAIPLLVYAAAPIVARYIAKKGIGAAIKKFTKKAINEGKKHADDVFKKNGGRTAEKAENIKKMRPVQNASANNRKTIRQTVAVAVPSTGAATYMLTKGKSSTKPKPSSTTTKGKSENPRNKNKVNKGMPKAPASKQVNPKDFPTYKKDTKSAGSFRAATTAAKKAGKKTFTWEGRKYSTKEK